MFGNKEGKQKRFKVIDEESISMIGITVLQDTETGVHYLVTQGMNGMATSPLLDKDGKVVVTEVGE